MLPGINGRELWEELHERYPRLDVIFVSGYTDDVMLRHGIEEGEYRFMQKPFSIESLAATVADVFAEHEKARAEGAEPGSSVTA